MAAARATRLLTISRTLLNKPSLSHLPLTNLIRPLSCVTHLSRPPVTIQRQTYATGQQDPPSSTTHGTNFVEDPGCDYEHWLVTMKNPKPDATRDDIIDYYIKTLAQVVGSEEDARMKIYSVSTTHHYAFGALLSENLTPKLKDVENVCHVIPDAYVDVEKKQYRGEPFINGQAVPYDPKYHEEEIRRSKMHIDRSFSPKAFKRAHKHLGFEENAKVITEQNSSGKK